MGVLGITLLYTVCMDGHAITIYHQQSTSPCNIGHSVISIQKRHVCHAVGMKTMTPSVNHLTSPLNHNCITLRLRRIWYDIIEISYPVWKLKLLNLPYLV